MQHKLVLRLMTIYVYNTKLSYTDSSEQRVDVKYIKNHFSLRR